MYEYMTVCVYVCRLPAAPASSFRSFDLKLRAIPIPTQHLVSSQRVGYCIVLYLEYRVLSIAYLSSGDDLKRAKSSLEVRGVALKVVKSASDAGLELAGLCTRWAVRRDLVDSTHICGVVEVVVEVEGREMRFTKF